MNPREAPILQTNDQTWILPNPTKSSPPLLFSAATRADMDVVADIVRSTADWYEELVDADDFDQHAVSESWAEKNFAMREFFVARVNGEIVGTVSMQDAGDTTYLGYVYLHADHVGTGYGRRLLQFAERMSRTRGKRAMVLLAHPEAHWAVRAYEKFGFDVLSAERDQVLAWNDAWLGPYYEEGFALLRYDLQA